MNLLINLLCGQPVDSAVDKPVGMHVERLWIKKHTQFSPAHHLKILNFPILIDFQTQSKGFGILNFLHKSTAFIIPTFSLSISCVNEIH